MNLNKEDALNMLKNAEKIFEINEYSEGKKCTVNALYYQIDKNKFIEHVERKYTNSNKVEAGYFIYDSLEPIIYALIHSEEPSIKKKADDLLKEYTTEENLIAIHLPKEIKLKVNALTDRFGCSSEIMLLNLISQGLNAEEEMNSYFDKYDRRILL